jgi:predicted RNA-binding Zn ribbon-like protein
MRKNQEAPGELELVRDLVNTWDLGDGVERLDSPAALGTWLTDNGLASPGVRVTRADFAHAIELREALREILRSHNGFPISHEADETLDAAVCRARLRLRIERGGVTRLEPEATGVDAALGHLLAIVHAAIAQGTWDRLKACRDDICQWAFYDHTKNHSGAWCTMEVCGNRAKARAYRERRAAASARA